MKKLITLLNMAKNIVIEDTTMHIMLNTFLASYKIFLLPSAFQFYWKEDN
jgi:hypothetical protein